MAAFTANIRLPKMEFFVCGRQVGGMADFINSSCDLCTFLIRGLNKTFLVVRLLFSVLYTNLKIVMIQQNI